MLHDVIGRKPSDIFKERKMGHPILQLPETTRGSRAGIINSLRSRPSAARFVRIKHTLAESNDSDSC